MQRLKENPHVINAIISIYGFGALLFIAYAGYECGLWLKNFF